MSRAYAPWTNSVVEKIELSFIDEMYCKDRPTCARKPHNQTLFTSFHTLISTRLPHSTKPRNRTPPTRPCQNSATVHLCPILLSRLPVVSLSLSLSLLSDSDVRLIYI